MELLARQFTERVQSLKQCVELQDMMYSSDGMGLLLNLETEIGELDKMMQELNNLITERKKSLKTAEVMKNMVLDMQARMKIASEQMPTHLPAKAKGPQEVVRMKKPSEKKRQYCESPIGNCMDDTTCPTFAQIRKNSPALFIPQIEYLTAAEFESVPKYMKLRMKYEQINQAIDELNKAMNAKAAIMSNKSRQNDHACKEYKTQETKDTKGLSFIVDKDITTLSHMKLDKNGHNILTILRHCQRIREIRGNRLVRYAFM